MTLNEVYLVASGLAYQKGLDNFDYFMPKSKAMNLYLAILETKGFGWAETNFINWLICIVGRYERKIPVCKKECKYKLKYDEPTLQRNALRIEIMNPSDRCGWKLKPGRIGGRPDDYYPCTKFIN